MLGRPAEQDRTLLLQAEARAEPGSGRGEPCFAQEAAGPPILAEPGLGWLQNSGGVPPHGPDEQGARRIAWILGHSQVADTGSARRRTTGIDVPGRSGPRITVL